MATAAATRIGVYVEIVVLEPPVSWLNWSSGRAWARVTCTLSTGSSSSSAISIAVEVVMPCPTSMRGSAKDAVPSLCTVTVIRLAVGRQESVSMSLRSYSSAGWGAVGAADAASTSPRSAAATSVAPPRTYPRKLRRRTDRGMGSWACAVMRPTSEASVPGVPGTSCSLPPQE